MARAAATDRPETLFGDVRWSDSESIAGFVEWTLAQKREYSRDLERRATMNVAHYMGHQSLFYNPRLGTLQRFPNQNWSMELYYNLLRPFADQVVAMMGAESVNYEAFPATDDIDDIERASRQTKVLRFYQEVLDIGTMEEEVDRWAFLTGEAIVKVTWDPDKGSDFDAAETLELTADEFREKFKRPNTRLRLGDVDAHVVDRQNIFWGPAGSRFADAEWVVEENERSREWTAARYGIESDDLRQWSGVNDGSEYREIRPDDLGPAGVITRKRRGNDNVRVVELWVKPGVMKDVPDGKHVVYVAGRVVKKGPIPYQHRTIPYRQFIHTYVPGRSTGDTPFNDAVGPQADLNRGFAQLTGIRETMANPFVLARTGSISNWSQWDGRPGGLREYVGDPPQIVPGTGAPSSLLIQLQQSELKMQDILGSHDVSRGKTPTGVKSGKAILALQEKDETRMAPVRRRRRRFWSEVGRLILSTFQQFATEQRAMAIEGSDGGVEAFTVAGQDLAEGGVNGLERFNVRVTTLGAPISRAARLEMIESLLQAGLFDPNRVPEHFRSLILRVLEMGSADALDPSRTDRANARTENRLMAKAQKIAPRDFDDDQTHIFEHERHMKTGRFRFDVDPKTQAVYEEHVAQHRIAIAQKALKSQLYAQIAMQRMQQIAPTLMGAGPGGATGGISPAPPASPAPQAANQPA